MKDVHATPNSFVTEMGLGQIGSILLLYSRTNNKEGVVKACQAIEDIINEYLSFDPKKFLLRQNITFLRTSNDFHVINSVAHGLSKSNPRINLKAIIDDAKLVAESNSVNDDIKSAINRLRRFLVLLSQESIKLEWNILRDNHPESQAGSLWPKFVLR